MASSKAAKFQGMEHFPAFSSFSYPDGTDGKGALVGKVQIHPAAPHTRMAKCSLIAATAGEEIRRKSKILIAVNTQHMEKTKTAIDLLYCLVLSTELEHKTAQSPPVRKSCPEYLFQLIQKTLALNINHSER